MFCYLKILQYINTNKTQAVCWYINNGFKEARTEDSTKYVCIQKKDSTFDTNKKDYTDTQYCLNCNLCAGIACRLPPADQTILDKLFISYIYSKIEHNHRINNTEHTR